MLLWEFIAICGIIFILLELFIPSMFFLNFAVASFVTSGVSAFTSNTVILVSVFFVFSFLSFAFLRPLIAKNNDKKFETGVNSKYIDKIAKVIEKVTTNSGAISIYDERWSARTEDGTSIEVGVEVKIIKNDSLVMYVEKLNK